MWPTVIIAINYGFEVLYTARALIRLEGILVNMIIMFYFVQISPIDMIKNTLHSLIAAMVMLIIAFVLSMMYNSIWWQFISMVICIIIYFVVIYLFQEERQLLFNKIFFINERYK